MAAPELFAVLVAHNRVWLVASQSARPRLAQQETHPKRPQVFLKQNLMLNLVNEAEQFCRWDFSTRRKDFPELSKEYRKDLELLWESLQL